MNWAVFSYAFVAGMVATVNPCGFAMLPAYLTWFTRADAPRGPSPVVRVPRAVAAGLATTGGFVVVFAAAGALVHAGAWAFMDVVPELGAAVGVALVVIGGLTAAGRHVGVRLPGSARPLGGRGRGPRAMVGFGISYALASLGCTLPIFLAAVAGTFTREGAAQGLGAFVAYGLGMGAVLTALALVVALAPGVGLRRLRALGGRMERPAGVLLVLVGAYLVYYWIADLAGAQAGIGLIPLVDRIDSTVAAWITSAGPRLGIGLLLLVIAAVVAARVVRSVEHRRSVDHSVDNADLTTRPAISTPTRHTASTAQVGSPPIPGTSTVTAEVSTGRNPEPPEPRRGYRHPLIVGLAAALVLAAYLGAVLASKGGSGPNPPVQVASDPTGFRVSPAVEKLTGLDPLPRGSWTGAPSFRLVDQHGRAVSLSSFRGKAVVLSFNDNHCTDVCPLYAKDVEAAVEDLGRLARRVAFVSVNTNPFYAQVKWDAAFDREYGLNNTPEWTYLTGSPAELRRVWHAYGIYVGLDYKHQTVNHYTDFYLIDPKGRERAIGGYGWSSVDTARWGNALAALSAELLGIHRNFSAHIVAAQRPQGRAGGAAPDFSLPSVGDPDTTRVALAQFAGRPLVINFFATWCSDCQAEASILEQLARRYDRKVNFVGIDTDGSPSDGRQFLHSFGISYPVGNDPTGVVAADYAVKDLPTTFVVSSTGTILHADLGPVTAASLGGQLAEILDHPTGP